MLSDEISSKMVMPTRVCRFRGTQTARTHCKNHQNLDAMYVGIIVIQCVDYYTHTHTHSETKTAGRNTPQTEGRLRLLMQNAPVHNG